MTLSEFKSITIKEYDLIVQRASNGNVIKDLMPLVRKCQIISFLSEESVSRNYEKMIINYFALNDAYKK